MRQSASTVIVVAIGVLLTVAVIVRSFSHRASSRGRELENVLALKQRLTTNPNDDWSLSRLMDIAAGKTEWATVRNDAIQTLGQVGAEPKLSGRVGSFLMKTTRDSSSQAREAACDALGDMGSVAAPAVDDILEAMTSAPDS